MYDTLKQENFILPNLLNIFQAYQRHPDVSEDSYFSGRGYFVVSTLPMDIDSSLRHSTYPNQECHTSVKLWP